ncbi:MAG: hypothetical protein R2764_14195 [Bacteroidales bacterium]
MCRTQYSGGDTIQFNDVIFLMIEDQPDTILFSDIYGAFRKVTYNNNAYIDRPLIHSMHRFMYSHGNYTIATGSNQTVHFDIYIRPALLDGLMSFQSKPMAFEADIIQTMTLWLNYTAITDINVSRRFFHSSKLNRSGATIGTGHNLQYRRESCIGLMMKAVERSMHWDTISGDPGGITCIPTPFDVCDI